MNSSHIYEDLEAQYHEQLWDELAPDMEAGVIFGEIPKTESPWLEIGSGSGRILKPLVSSGQNIEGLEPSEPMITESKTALPDTVHHHTTFQAFETEQKYGAILFTAFVGSLLDDLDAALIKAKNMLEPGGHLAITQFVPWSELTGEAPENKWYTDQKIPLEKNQTLELRTKHQIQRHSQKLTREHKYFIKDAKGKILQTHHCQQNLRWYYYQELCEKLRHLGFTLNDTFWNLSHDQLDEESPVFTLFAKKP